MYNTPIKTPLSLRLFCCLFLLLHTLALTELVAAAALPTVSLVKDINTTLNSSSDPANFVKVGNITFFTAETPTTGRELWKTDGTAAGTVLVKDINPGSSGSSPGGLIVVNNVLYFCANDAVHGYELWRSDGTAAGTVMVKDIYPGNVYNDPQPYNLTAIGNVLYFAADDGVHGTELWRSDGTAAGTVMVKDIMAGIDSSSPRYLTAVGNVLYFSASMELWKSDGTAAGTVLVKDINVGDYPYFTAIGNMLYFRANDGVHGSELWKSDGTESGTVLVKDIYPGNNADGNPNSSSPGSLIAVGTVLYFRADDGVHGYELWKSNGTTAGTVLVKDIQAGSDSPFCGYYTCYDPYFTAVGNVLYFVANDGVHGRELWKSNGTTAGTVLVKDIKAGSGSVFCEKYRDREDDRCYNPNFTAVGTVLYFRANNGVNGFELWKSDGAAAGTVLVKDIYPGNNADGNPNSSSPGYLIAVGTVLYFRANDGVHGNELWKSDGSTAGTVLVKNINPGTGNSLDSYSNFTTVGNILYFAADNSVNGSELWKSDGSTAGTVMVKDINAVSDSALDSDSNLTAVGTVLYFSANDGVHGSELWKSDGTAAGTFMVKDIDAGSSDYYGPHGALDSYPKFTAVGNVVYFVADDGVYGMELWKSDGTPAGTVLVKDIYAGSDRSWPGNLTAVGSVLYFVADDGVHEDELWKSDGTAAGTVLVKDIYPGSGFSYLYDLTAVGNMLYFEANDDVHGYELWRSDGTAAGTVMVKDIYPGSRGYIYNFTAVGTVLYFFADNGVNGFELWRSDGTESGTVLVKDINPGSGSAWSYPYYPNLTAVGSLLYFNANNGINGDELWRSDGTAAGTVMVKDIWPGIGGSHPYYLTAVGNLLYFQANNGINGDELWQTDGTAAGTQMIELVPGRGGSNPQDLFAVGTQLYFAAQTEATGRELWRADIPNNLYTVTPNAGTGGTVSPNTAQIVTQGATASFTVTANTGYTRNNAVTGSCPQGSWTPSPLMGEGRDGGEKSIGTSTPTLTLPLKEGGNVWTTGAIIANCSVSFSFTPIITTPTATTNAASNISATSAKLNGSVVSSGATATVSFEFGTTTSYGTNLVATPAQVYSATSVAVSANVSTPSPLVGKGRDGGELNDLPPTLTFSHKGGGNKALSCNTTYHFRTKAVNSAGTGYGADKTFTTTACPINGVCGTANGGTFATIPTANLCNVGTASAVTVDSTSSPTSYWNWNCAGMNGGITANCSANIQTIAINSWLYPTTMKTPRDKRFTLTVTAKSDGMQITNYDYTITFDPNKLLLVYSECDNGVCIGANNTLTINAVYPSYTNSIKIKGLGGTTIAGNDLQLLIIHFKSRTTLGATSVTLQTNALENTSGDTIGLGAAGATINVSTGICGDANGDTMVNIIDSLAIARKLVGLPPPPTIEPLWADVNYDSNATITDALHIARYSIGLVLPPEVCNIGQPL